jgi:hypothetical protein
VYFVVKGQMGYVLPRFKNKIYRLIEKGEHFGHLELAESPFLFESFKKRRRIQKPIRRFTVQSLEVTEMLVIN